MDEILTAMGLGVFGGFALAYDNNPVLILLALMALTTSPVGIIPFICVTGLVGLIVGSIK
jgi:phage shock protein PspC (stress-responsive transcriptional regulator)